MTKDNFTNIELKLKIFNEIERNVSQSQRSLSKELGVALGLANSLLKKFVKKDYDYFIFIKNFIYFLFRKNLKPLFFERSNFLEHVLLKCAATCDDAS